MAYIGNFDATQVEPMGNFEPIPAGEYLAKIIESEVKPNKARTGEYLQLKFQVIEGKYQNRTVMARLNLKHDNPQTVAIANSELSSICRAAGINKIQDSQQIHNVPMRITVAVTNPNSEGKVYNEIKGYAKRGVPANEEAAVQPVEAVMVNAQSESQGQAPGWM